MNTMDGNLAKLVKPAMTGGSNGMRMGKIQPQWTFWLACSLLAGVTLPASQAVAAAAPAVSATVRFEPTKDEAQVPKPFQLASHQFDVQLRPLAADLKNLSITRITFPSPVVSPVERNNTVHGEYFCPIEVPAAGEEKKARKKMPAVVVLHILGGDFELSRTFCHALAQKGVASLFIQLPYYGDRRVRGGRKMISHDPGETVEGLTQAVLDIRRATAWLASREELDPARLGIFGISLGGITAALAAEAEPRLTSVCLLLAGGDLVKIAAESLELEPIRKRWKIAGSDPKGLVETLKPVDPLTHAGNLKGRRVLMMNATHDEVIPKTCTEMLWAGCGKPEILWYEGGHYSVIRYLLGAIKQTTQFFSEEKKRK